MKKNSLKKYWIIFMLGSLSPLLAMLILPKNYSFYMFLPAPPETAFERVRMFTADSMLVIGLLITLAASSVLLFKGLKQKRYLVLICPLIILLNPIQQMVFLEPLDKHMNYQWRDRAVQHNIIGKTPDEIKKIFGDPSYEWTRTPQKTDADGNITWQGEKYTGWNYHVIPIYWFGSKFQVFFKKGKVSSFEANDD